MLKVGLTGGLGSGKSTVASMLRGLGAHVIEADELGRTLMEPGHVVYDDIVRTFGRSVVTSDGRLDRPKLARLAFENGRLDELNAIVHPAVIAAQQQWMSDLFARQPAAVAVVESALIFEVERDARARGESEGVLADWRNRFDAIIVVTAPDDVKIARYTARVGQGQEQGSLAADARVRLARQIPDAEKSARADFVIENTGDLAALRQKVESVWEKLMAEGASRGAKTAARPA
jgi:dephospho-CoA kinase